MSVWIAVVWLLTTTPAAPTPVLTPTWLHAATEPACQHDVLAHLRAAAPGALVAVSRCVEVRPWLRVIEPR